MKDGKTENRNRSRITRMRYFILVRRVSFSLEEKLEIDKTRLKTGHISGYPRYGRPRKRIKLIKRSVSLIALFILFYSFLMKTNNLDPGSFCFFGPNYKCIAEKQTLNTETTEGLSQIGKT